MNYELCTMLTFFRLKSFSIFLFISTMFVVFTSAAYNHHKFVRLSCLPLVYACSESFEKASDTHRFSRLLSLYCTVLSLKAFILLMPAEVGFMHMCNNPLFTLPIQRAQLVR